MENTKHANYRNENTERKYLNNNFLELEFKDR